LSWVASFFDPQKRDPVSPRGWSNTRMFTLLDGGSSASTISRRFYFSEVSIRFFVLFETSL
jgi:hypothetical protein